MISLREPPQTVQRVRLYRTLVYSALASILASPLSILIWVILLQATKAIFGLLVLVVWGLACGPWLIASGAGLEAAVRRRSRLLEPVTHFCVHTAIALTAAFAILAYDADKDTLASAVNAAALSLALGLAMGPLSLGLMFFPVLALLCALWSARRITKWPRRSLWRRWILLLPATVLYVLAGWAGGFVTRLG